MRIEGSLTMHILCPSHCTRNKAFIAISLPYTWKRYNHALSEYAWELIGLAKALPPSHTHPKDLTMHASLSLPTHEKSLIMSLSPSHADEKDQTILLCPKLYTVLYTNGFDSLGLVDFPVGQADFIDHLLPNWQARSRLFVSLFKFCEFCSDK